MYVENYYVLMLPFINKKIVNIVFFSLLKHLNMEQVNNLIDDDFLILENKCNDYGNKEWMLNDFKKRIRWRFKSY